MNDLMAKILASGSIKHASILSDSPYFNAKDLITTELPILNLAFSGDILGGFVPGLTVFAGISKTFKTLLTLYCLKAYLNKYPEGVGIIFDSEFSITPEYLKSIGIDPDRVIHIPIEHIEQLKFDIVKRLDVLKRDDRVFFMIDSLGNLSSKKELEDAENEKSVADMTRAKSIRGMLRIITPSLTMKNLPCFIVNHVYNTMELYSKTIVGGGTAVMYSANQIFIITKAQEKDGDELVGNNFTINIEKSRFVREKSKFVFTVLYDTGIAKYSGLFDIAKEGGYIVAPKQGWYQRKIANKETGEVKEDKNWRKGDTDIDEFWSPIFDQTDFSDYLKKAYKL